MALLPTSSPSTATTSTARATTMRRHTPPPLGAPSPRRGGSKARSCALALRRLLARFAVPLTSLRLHSTRIANRLVRAASKFLIALAASLIAMCAWIFLTVLLPAKHPNYKPVPSNNLENASEAAPAPASADADAGAGSDTQFISLVFWWLMWPFAALVLVNLYFNFTLACATSNFSERVGADNMEDLPIDIPVCSKCNSHKPERCRHCSICRRCVYKMDHHCPWIDNCVGNNNHRYFFLFLVYLMISCIVYAIYCLPYIVDCLRVSKPWTVPVSRFMFAFSAWCAVAVGLVLIGMVGWSGYLIGRGRTQLEWAYSDSATLRKFDIGYRANFSVFFNTFTFPWYYVFLPVRVPPYSDGYIYPISEQAEPEFYAL